jgi:hypothetical protein
MITVTTEITEPTCWAWWYKPVIPALGRLRQEDCKFEASLDYITETLFQNQTKQNK